MVYAWGKRFITTLSVEEKCYKFKDFLIVPNHLAHTQNELPSKEAIKKFVWLRKKKTQLPPTVLHVPNS